MIDNISYEELVRLKDGEPPWSINEDWDCAMVIDYLVKKELSVDNSLNGARYFIENNTSGSLVMRDLEENNLCEHGFEDWDECPDCRH